MFVWMALLPLFVPAPDSGRPMLYYVAEGGAGGPGGPGILNNYGPVFLNPRGAMEGTAVR